MEKQKLHQGSISYITMQINTCTVLTHARTGMAFHGILKLHQGLVSYITIQINVPGKEQVLRAKGGGLETTIV
jgi:hypothetical protein